LFWVGWLRCCGPPQRARRGDDDEGDRDDLAGGQVLREGEEADRRRDRRLEAHQHAEDRAGQAAQRLHLEGVRDRRAQHSDGGADQEVRGDEELGAALRDPERGDEGGRDHRRQGRPADARFEGTDPGALEDVGAPEEAGDQRQPHAEGVEGLALGPAGEEDDAGGRQQRPDEVATPPRAEQRNPERPDELQGHRDPERQPVESRVEAEVDRGHREPEQPDVAVRPLAGQQQSAAHQRQQRQGAETGPEEDGAGRPDRVEEAGREGRPTLDRDDRSRHQERRAARPLARPLVDHPGIVIHRSPLPRRVG
jgi:hypothetical protein